MLDQIARILEKHSPPIAGQGGIAQSEGLTTQYLYDDNLADGVGLDGSAGVSPAILPSSSPTWKVSLATAIAKLAAAETAGDAALTFSSTAPGRASVVINPEFEVSFTISDAAGRTVMRDRWIDGATHLLLTQSGKFGRMSAIA